jgi:hypothetical protein
MRFFCIRLVRHPMDGVLDGHELPVVIAHLTP